MHIRSHSLRPLLAVMILISVIAGGFDDALAQSADQHAAHSSDRAPSPLVPNKLYNSIRQPLLVTVPEPQPAGDAIMTVVAMDARGRFVTHPVDVQPGEVDLAELMPALRDIRRTCYIQLFIDDKPAGAALVVQPMLPRIIPLTERRQRHGREYTHIVGWQDENAPLPGETQEQPANQPTDDENDQLAIDDSQPIRAESASEGEIDRILSSQPINGWRVFSEHDVILHTEYGQLHITLRPDAAPNTAWNFSELAAGGLYNGAMFHRIVPVTRDGDPFVIQGGDPAATGEGGPGYWLPIEPSSLQHDFGVVSMARADDPDSAGSQFFICLSREGTARLDGQYCAFGEVVTGAETILKIADVELADIATGKPVSPPKILDVEVIPAQPRIIGQGRPDRRVTREQIEARPTEPERVPR